ncbi:MAG: hypothetical protein HDS14_00475 [Bacteroides sp.]|nr:hypothetical protein [Bacteroides sp.]
MENYGGTFNSSETGPLNLGFVKLWHDVEEILPGGARMLPSDDFPVGKIVPGGIPVSVDKPGGTPTLNSATPDGLNKDDRMMGKDGCSLTIVTRGSIYALRTEATITEPQKKHLAGRILFINA